MHPSSTNPVQVMGLREVCQVDGHHFKRIRGQEHWIAYKPEDIFPPPGEREPMYLSLIHKARGPDEPIHWSLFVARENEPGWLFQVPEDAEHMTYQPSDTQESPHYAVNRQAVTDNCQGWVIRVLVLAEEGIVCASKLEIGEVND
ncbi:hypothetical protein BDV23DRAFT_179052 [Aspergillus alliaceus]|uniref:Uncharacterized protein n=1 Tax=Petromyces alliaceus TaxID=209559 RepID=A0A5N7CLI4_PETAA|nr:hypothetical protein BDV23DRAFT_179052 [Aspergillus alliaceus]